MSNFRRNLIASYASQIYVAAIGIVIVPVYIRYMGTEAYGLVGFYAMLQAWFQMLDMGLSPTISRQTARLSGGAITNLELRRLLRVLEGIFAGVALAGTLALWLGSAWISTHWLQAQTLPLVQVQLSIELMAGIIGLRWVAGLYRGAIGGFEQQVWLGRLNASMATARFVVVLAIFEILGTKPAHFFGWQLMVAVVETTLLVRKTYKLLPAMAPDGPRVGWHWNAMRDVIGFSLSIAFTSAVWVGVTQTDKLVLSKILPLAEYGHFTLAVLAASGVTIISGPLSTALMPRLARLQAQGDESGFLILYRQATQGMAVVALPVATVLGLCAEPLLLAWTGDALLARETAPILRLYALGNGVMALAAFPYYLQFAKGDVRLHLIGNVIFVLALIPSIILASMKNGAIGAGWAWLGANLLYSVLWTWRVHHRLAPNLHQYWFWHDIMPVAVMALLTAAILYSVMPWDGERSITLIKIITIGLIVLAVSCTGSSNSRRIIRQRFKKLQSNVTTNRTTDKK